MSNSIHPRRVGYSKNGTSMLLLLSVGLTASPAYCDNKAGATSQSDAGFAAQVQPNQSAATGLSAFIDPKTGKLRTPTDEEVRQLNQQASSKLPMGKTARGVPAPAQKLLPSGAISMPVGENGMSYVVAKRNRDGSVFSRCDTESKSAQQALHKLEQSAATLNQGTGHDR
ncbi:MAG: hypothetical protein ABL903_07985 [Methylococcales bacterium]